MSDWYSSSPMLWWMFLSIWMEGGAWPPMPMMEEVEDSFLSEMAESEVEVNG